MSVAEEFDKRIEEKDYEGAIAVLTKAWHSQYDTSFYLSNMGWTLNQLERPLEAISHLAKAISLFPDDSWNYSQIGYSYQIMNRYEDALFNFKKAVEYGSDDVWVNSRIAFVLVELARHNEAIEYYQNALMDSPEDTEIRIALGNCYCHIHEFDRAYEEWEIVIKATHDESIIESCVLSLFQEGAIDLAKKLLNYMSDSPRRYYLDAVLAFEDKEYEQAVLFAQKSIDHDIDHTGVRQLMSDAYFQLGDEEHAFEQLRIKREYWMKAVDKQDEEIGLFRHIGMVSITLHDYDVAEEYLLRALEMDPEDAASLYFYSNALVYNGKYEESLPYFLRLRKIDPESLTPESMYNEAYSYFYLKKFEETIQIVTTFQEKTPEDLLGYMLELLAESYYNIEEYGLCVTECLNSLSLDSDQLSVYRLMASANSRLRDNVAVSASILAAAERSLMDEEFYEFSTKMLKEIKDKDTLKKIKQYYKKTK